MNPKFSLSYENRIGIKFFYRNKLRSSLGIIGMVFAGTIFGSVLLISYDQARMTTLSRIKGIENPIIINDYTTDEPVNSTRLKEIVQQVESLSLHSNDRISSIHYNLQIKAKYANASYLKIDSYLFPTMNASIDWVNLNISSTKIFNNLKLTGDNSPSLNLFKNLYGNKLDDIILQGNIPSQENEILISKFVADAYSLHINDTINFCYNGTRRISVGYNITGIYTKNSWYPGVIGDHIHYIYMEYQTMERLLTDLNSVSTTFTDFRPLIEDGGRIEIFIDTNRIDAFNIDSLIQELTYFAISIQSKIDIDSSNYIVTNNLSEYSGPIWEIKEIMNIIGYFLFILGLIVPIIISSIYFSYLLISELLERRRKELAQLRSKGFNQRQLKQIILPEMLLSIIITTITASILGIIVSFGFHNFLINFSDFKQSSSATYIPFYTPTDFFSYVGIVCLFLSIIICLIYKKPLERVQKTEIIENLKDRIKGTTNSIGNAALTALITGIIPIIGQITVIILDQSGYIIFASGYENIFSILFCFSPFLIGFYLIDTITKRHPRLFSRLMIVFFLKLSSSIKQVISRNIISRSQKIGRLMIIIMFTIGFNVMSQVVNGSIVQKTDFDNGLIQGSDLKAYGRFNYNDTKGILYNLSAVESVRNLTSIYWMDIRCDAAPQIEIMCAVEFESLFESINYDIDNFIIDNDKRQLSSLIQNHTVALAPITAKNNFEKGNNIQIEIPVDYYRDSIVESGVVRISCIIGGYYKAIPGIVPINSEIKQYNGNPLIINLEPSTVLNESTIDVYPLTILIKSNTSTPDDITSLKYELSTKIPLMTYNTLSDTIEQQKSTTLLSSLNAFGFFELLNLDTWMMFFISILSVGILMISRITQERKEIALVRVKGFIRKQVSQIHLIEYLMPVLFGVIGGLIVGIFTGWILSANLAQSFTFFHPSSHILVQLNFTFMVFLTSIAIPIGIITTLVVFLIKRETTRNISTTLTQEQ